MYLTEHILNKNWRLYISENRLCKDFAEEIRDELSLKSHGISAIPAAVPGNFELDMQKAGLIEDPFYGKNPLIYKNTKTVIYGTPSGLIIRETNPKTPI